MDVRLYYLFKFDARDTCPSLILDRVCVVQEGQLRYAGPNLNTTTLGILQ